MIDQRRPISGIKGELRDFADSLAMSDFRPLSRGIGIGDGKKRISASPAPSLTAPMQLQEPEIVRRVPNINEGRVQAPTLSNVKVQAPIIPEVSRVQVSGISDPRAQSSIASETRVSQKKQSQKNTGKPRPAQTLNMFRLTHWLARSALGHIIDLIFSAIAVVSMLTIAGMATQAVGLISGLKLARGWLGVLGPLEMISALYGTFLLYLVIFQAFVGGTIGSQIAGDGAAKQPKIFEKTK